MKRAALLVSTVLALLFVSQKAFAQATPIIDPATNVQVWPYVGQTAGPIAPLDTMLVASGQPQFIAPLPIPVDYTPDKTTYATPQPWDYYEIAYKPVTAVGPWIPPGQAGNVPGGTQWLGLCTPGTFNAKTNTCAAPLYTPVWGFAQVNSGGGPLGGAATYPSMNIRATRGTPVKVKWMNQLPNTHLFCPQPQNYNWPCAIDRTLMGTQVGTGVGPFGGSQQPDNAVVVHLHGGDVPPEADGFAEFWIGNAATSLAYTPNNTTPIDPPLSLYTGGAPTPLIFYRPVGTAAIYNYPMVQDAMMLWFHDHALGKTRINVAAGPAGFFQVNEPGVEPPGCSTVAAGTPCLPDTSAKGTYELNVVLQDRDFNAPQVGSNLAPINYPNALNWAQVAPVAGQQPLAPGGNPTVHPQWVPEYFGTIPIVNGMAWPFFDIEPRMYRLHLLAGSNSRCWNLGRSDGLPFTVIGTEQGYLNAPVSVVKLTMCPGERYDTIWDFTAALAKAKIVVTNNAPAPFPRGVAPTGSDVGRVLQFRVTKALNAAVPNGPLPAALINPIVNAPLATPATVLCPFDPLKGGQALHATPAPGTTCQPMRQKVLNENLDAVTLFPLRVQIDGTSFEGAITERPIRGAVEVWRIVNTTGDAHPIHTHLVRHQIISRQKFDLAGFSAATNFAVPLPLLGMTGTNAPPICPPGSPAATPACFNLGVDVTPFLTGAPKLPGAWEAGWKDTSIAYPGEVLTLVAKWEGHWNTATPDPAKPILDPLTGAIIGYSPAFLADTSGPYVWHCHIVDHEDNEMMRPIMLQ